MSRILKRPMFRKGGEVMEGVMTGIKPRQNYNIGSGNEGVVESVKNKMNLIDMVAGGRGPDGLSQFLIGGGLNLVSGENEGDNVLQTIAGAYKKPTEQLFAQQSRDAQSRRLLAGQLIAKSTVGDAAKAWKEYGKYTGLSEEDFYKQYGRSKLYKDEPTPQMKQAKLKGDFVKNLTKKKNFLQESDVDSNEAAQIFEGYQSLVNGNKDLAKQIDSGQLYIPKSAESFEQVKGGFVPNDTDGMRTNKIYFDFNNLMGQGQTWFLFDGTKLIPKARVD
jgi:hypothetical protein